MPQVTGDAPWYASLKRELHEHGMTLKELCLIIGVSPTYFTMYNSRGIIPSAAVMVAACSVVGIPPISVRDTDNMELAKLMELRRIYIHELNHINKRIEEINKNE